MCNVPERWCECVECECKAGENGRGFQASPGNRKQCDTWHAHSMRTSFSTKTCNCTRDRVMGGGENEVVLNTAM